MTAERPSIQQVIPGYELLEKIGQGGMGAVYRARQQSMDRIVALKILPKSLARRAEFKERFFREARAAGKLNHSNIVSAYDAQEANGYCYIAMEFVDGETVANKIKREGALPEEEALHIAHQIAAALAHAWKSGIVHRDVKPENFLYTKERIAKLCDLGIAKAPADANLTQDGIALGTPRYISPEQARGVADLDYRTDIYSLGASLYHMLAGVPPFDGPTPAAIMLAHVNDPLPPLRSRAPQVSKATAQVVERMMAKEPASRYTSAEDFLADLDALRRGETPPIAGASKRPSVRRVVAPRRASASRPAAHRSNLGGIIALAAIAVVLLFAVVFWPSSETLPPSSLSASDKEDCALESLRKAREEERSGNLAGALSAYQQLLSEYPDTQAAALAKAEMEKAQRAWEERKAKQQRESAAAQAWQALQKESAALPPAEYLKRLQAFAKEWGNTPSAAVALAEAQRVEKAEAAKAEEKKAEEKKEESPEERRRRFISEAREALKGQDREKINRVLEVVERFGPELQVLAPEISHLAHTAPSSGVRRRSLAALAKAAAAAATKAALALLQDRNEAVRLEAIRIVRESKERTAAPLLQRLVDGDGPDAPPDPSPRVRKAAREALNALAP